MGLAIAVMLVISFSANATPKRVGFFANQIAGQDYTSLQTAHDFSSPGDTLLIFPGSWSATFTKRLVLIGYGYFVTGTGANSGLQNITLGVSIFTQLLNGSKGTNFEGLDNLTVKVDPFSDIDSIKVKRCRVSLQLYDKNLSNWEIKQSYILSVNSADIYGRRPIFKSLSIQNCYIAEFGAVNLFSNPIRSVGVFKNNVFGISTINFLDGDFTLINNIFLGELQLVNRNSCTFQNNIAQKNIIPSGNGNKPNVPIANVCKGYPDIGNNSNDSRYELKSNSPAFGAGIDSVDCGMFGGAEPYRLSGIPAIPSFYKLTSSSPITGASPYTITFSVRSNN